MRRLFEELDFQETPLGDLILRKRRVAALDDEAVYEVTLDGEFLMSGLVNDAEIALTDLGMELLDGRECDVLVGGLGLGFTAATALRYPTVRSLSTIEYLPAVIGWHERGLVPLGKELTSDPRSTIVQGDFFDMLRSGRLPREKFDAMLIDIDHSPRFLLNESHADFYEVQGLRKTADSLTEGGVLAVWSADGPDDEFIENLEAVFPTVRTEQVEFYNPLFGERDINTIFLAKL